MPRKPLPKATETAVLLLSRRRCCICFGLDRDTRLKSGQIAHLDKDPNNHIEGNLAFLCFDHHDQFDSTASQRKNLTIGEVKAFRSELYSHLNQAFTQQVHFGEISTPPADPFAGSWIRLGAEANSAEILLTPLPEWVEAMPRYFISGFATFGADRPSGPNLGVLEFVGTMSEDRQMVYHREILATDPAETRMQFAEGGIMIVTEKGFGGYGFNVDFAGTYRRRLP